MALFNYANREITAKIVYYGPGVCGKTTSLQYIHERIAPVQRGRLLSLATETDRTIFFDLLPLKLGEIRGFKLRFQLYTVPGQVKYNKTRKLVLQGADAIVFVADSQVNRREKNIESLKNLQENLKEQGKSINDLPLVFEYNKRDLENVLSVEQLNQDLNPKNLPFFPAVATKGVGVMETLEAISKTALHDIEQRLNATATTDSAEQDEDELSFDDGDLLDLTGDGETLDTSLSLSDDLDSLELDDDLDLMGDDGTLESQPIGYDNSIQVEEMEIRADAVAQTGTLKESEFFDLKDIEEQALRELDEFIDGSLGDSDFDMGGDAVLSGDDLTFDALEDTGGGSDADDGMSGFSFVDSGSDDAGGGELDFSFSASPVGDEDEDAQADDDGGLDFSFSASPLGEEDDAADSGGLDFSFTAGAGDEDDMLEEADELGLEPDSLLDFTLGDTPGGSGGGSAAEAAASPMEPLELSEDDLDFSSDAEEPDSADDDLTVSFGDDDELPSFTLPDDEKAGGKAGAPVVDEDLVEFSLDGTEAAAAADGVGTDVDNLDAFNLSDTDLDLSFDDDEDEDSNLPSLSSMNMQADEDESGEPYDFRITDSVRFEMQHSEEISSVTPFEKQLDELSDDMFTAEDTPAGGEFEPDESGGEADEEFQALSDESTRQLVIAKYFYQQGEVARARQTARAHIQATMMYYLSIETALKAVALKFETCNPAVASLKIILDSIEEETEKTISGRKSVMDNIVALKDAIQMETAYPDQDSCELAARICDRFLSTLAEEFLALDMTELSPILPEPTDQ